MKIYATLAVTLSCCALSLSVAAQSTKAFHAFGWNAYGLPSANAFNTFRNEASAARAEHFVGGIIAEQRFLLEELSSFAFIFSLPTSSGTFSLSGQNEGVDNFKVIKTGFIYSRLLTPWLDIGARFDYLNMRVTGYGSAAAVTFSLGTIIHWNKKWHTGLQAYNPANKKFDGLGNDPVPTLYRVGTGFQPSENFILSAEVSKTGNLPAEGTTVFQYQIIQHLSLTGGVGTGDNDLFFGLTIHLKQIQIITSACHHSRLGLGPATGFIFENK